MKIEGLATALRLEMARRNIKQKTLAVTRGMSESSVTNLMDKEEVHMAKYLKPIAEFLKITVDSLMEMGTGEGQ